MDINVENVTAKFKLYSGEAMDGTDTARDGLCGELCEECAELVRLKVKPEVLQAEGTEGAGALESLAAADRMGSAERLRREKRAACAGLLAEDGFYFGTA